MCAITMELSPAPQRPASLSPAPGRNHQLVPEQLVWKLLQERIYPTSLLALCWDAHVQTQIWSWYLIHTPESHSVLVLAPADPSATLNTKHPRAAGEKSPEIML